MDYSTCLQMFKVGPCYSCTTHCLQKSKEDVFKHSFLRSYMLEGLCISTYASGFIYPKIFDDCVVLLKTCYIVIVCHDLPSLQKFIMTVLIIRNQAWNENV